MSKTKTNRSSSRLAAVQALYQYAFGEKTIDEIAREFIAGDIGREVIEENEMTGTEIFVPVMPAEPTLFAGILSSYAENSKQINLFEINTPLLNRRSNRKRRINLILCALSLFF